MVGRPPKPRGTATNRRKVLDKLLSDLASHQASNAKEAFERKSGRRMTEEELEAIQPPLGQPSKTSR